jgi:hypothetical protein
LTLRCGRSPPAPGGARELLDHVADIANIGVAELVNGAVIVDRRVYDLHLPVPMQSALTNLQNYATLSVATTTDES